MSRPEYAAARRHLGRRDPVLKAVIRKHGPCTLVPTHADPFTVLVRCVVYQQISTKAARSIFERLMATIGGPPASASVLAGMTEEQLRACGLSAPKQRTLRAVIAHAAANPELLPTIGGMDDDEIRRQLCVIKGIGPWSADMFLMFGLGRPDVLPVGDLGLRQAVRKFWELEELPGPAELFERAENWRPYRTVATWYLWRALGPVPQSGTGG